MLLETIKALVVRFANYNDIVEQAQSPSNVIEETTPPNQTTQAGSVNAKPSAYPNNAPDPNSGLFYGEQPAATMLGSDFFSNAHDVVMNNPTLISYIINSGRTVLQLLEKRMIRGAEVDSSARDPPPKCHPDTRKGLRIRITDWVTNADRHWRMLWVMGPMGVGKSALAQTIAEELKEIGRLGAALFFSRPGGRDDPNGVIPTLAYQLAVKIPEYRRIITQVLADNPGILEKNRRTQFKELIIDPFQNLMTQRVLNTRQPLLIIIDGLDECNGKEAQCEFIELIGEHARRMVEFPLLWMICSRPEWHLKGMLSHPDFHVPGERENLLIDDGEAQQDVTHFLRDRFRDIYHKYQDRLEPGWPLEAYLRQISISASGHFAFASTIVKFVGDQSYADPRGQLDLCVRFLGGSGIPGAMNPLHALDLLYRQVLSDVPDHILATTMRILGVSILYPNVLLTTHNQANFLCIDQSNFYRSLQYLHSVLDIPSGTDAVRHPLRFYHASFSDYLSDPRRSGLFTINKLAVHYDVATHSLMWQRRPVSPEVKHDGYSSPFPALEWVRPEVKAEKVLSDLRNLSSAVGWEACCRVSAKDLPSLITQLKYFGFKEAERDLIKPANFLVWLYKLGDRTRSLIWPVMSSDSTTHENVETLSMTHTTDNVGEYLSASCWHPGATSDTPGVDAMLRLQLSEANITCNIDLGAERLGGMYSFAHHRSRRWPTLNAVIAADSPFIRFRITDKPIREIFTPTFNTFRQVPVFTTRTHYLRLFSKFFPWSIEIPSEEEITCEWVWNAVWSMLQQPMKDSEWGMLFTGGPEGEKKINTILEAREKRLELDPTSDKGVLRRDYLGEDIWFLGLEKDEEYETTRLLPESRFAQAPAPDATWLVRMGR